MKKSLLAFSVLACGMGFAVCANAGTIMDDSDVDDSAAMAAPASVPTSHAFSASSSEHVRAIRLARSGDTASALSILSKLHNESPSDVSITRDYLLVSNWAGNDNDVVHTYKELSGKQPDYVLLAAGQSYRNLKQPADALTVYKLGLQRSPGSPVFMAGVIRSMADDRKAKEALDMAKKDLLAHGERMDILLAAAYAAQVNGQEVEGLRYCFRAVHLDPKSKIAQHDLIVAIDVMGAPQVARERADQMPGILSRSEYRSLKGDEAAAAVRWENLEPANEATRYAATDRAINTLNELIAGWSKEGDSAKPNILRARFDRLIALHDRVRMKDVLAEYDDMTSHNIVVPNYAMTAVGDAYLYEHQPEKARDIYLGVLQKDPTNFDARVQLFYAYVETNDFQSAYKAIDSLDTKEPVWIYLKGLPEPVANPARSSSDIMTGYARLYGEEYAKAEQRIGAIEGAAPDNNSNRAALGNIYESRGWPRSAQEQYDIGAAMMQGHDVNSEVGQARTNLELQNYQAVEAQSNELAQRFPENLDVQHAKYLWNVHNMWELDVNAENSFRSSNSAAGGNGFALDTRLYSRPIDYNWRIFADELWAYEAEPFGEGGIHLSSSAAGLEYRGYGLTASLAPTFNYYNSGAIGTTGNDRVGGLLNASYSINDVWTVGTDDEIFSRDTPLRALNAGVTANSYKVDATYRASDAAKVDLNAEFMNFSDQNMRSTVGLAYDQRLWTNPYFKVDAISDLGESQNSLDENRLYYNPKADAMGLFGIDITQILYRRYEIQYEHDLKYTPGPYWEDHFGTSLAQVVEYHQALRINDVFEAGAGVSFARQDYDGEPENNVSLLGNLVYRF